MPAFLRTLVTGATGHLGANLVRRLLSDGHRVRVLIRPGGRCDAVDGLPVERAIGDLRDAASLAAAVEGCSHAYHCAAAISITAGRERELFDTNVIGTRNLLAAAARAGVQRVVVTGSLGAVAHHPDRPSNEDDVFNPFAAVLPYEQSKAAMEHVCLEAVAAGQDVVIAISCAILGPYDFKPSRMGRVVRDVANGRMRAYIPGGFEFVAARDIVQGHLLAMQRGRRGERYIFSTEFVTVDTLMDWLEEITGRPRPPLRLPPALMAAIARVASPVLSRLAPGLPQRLTPGAIRLLRLHRRADCSKAKQQLGYQPTSAKAAVRDAFDWFVAAGQIPGAAPAAGRPAPRLEEV
jgi:nucleoside-diphosphate-sugar epimerase